MLYIKDTISLQVASIPSILKKLITQAGVGNGGNIFEGDKVLVILSKLCALKGKLSRCESSHGRNNEVKESIRPAVPHKKGHPN